MPAGTYPAASPAISVQALLKQPRRISRDLASLVYQRLIADKLFLRGDPAEVAGGTMQFQRAESIFLDAGQDVEEIAPRADWPRSTWTEALMTEVVKQFGLEVPIDNLAIRRNQVSRITRAEIKLANNLVRFIDTLAINKLTDATAIAAGINTQASAAAWTIPGTDIIAEIGKAQEAIETKNNGYNGFENAVLVLHVNRRDDLLNNTVLRAALPRERDGQIATGQVAPFLGLRDIVFTTNITVTNAILLDPTMAGTIADEQPDQSEGWTAFLPQNGYPPIWVMVYPERRPKGQVVAAGRWPAMALTDPGAVTLITGV